MTQFRPMGHTREFSAGSWESSLAPKTEAVVLPRGPEPPWPLAICLTIKVANEGWKPSARSREIAGDPD